MWLRCAFYSLLPFGLAVFAPGQTTANNSCQAPDPIRAAIREAGNVDTEKDGRRRAYDEVRQERQQRFKELVAKNPEDFWVLRAYIDAMKSSVSPDEVIAQFRERYESSPKNAQAAYLYARALTGKDTAKAVEILTSLVETAPSFPWPFADLANIYDSPNFNDSDKRKRLAEGFIDRCPASNQAVYLATRLDKSDKLTTFAKALRERIAGKADEETVPLYRSLWMLEFKLAPLNEQAPLRERVAEDLRFLAGLDREKFKSASFLLQEGYKLTSDKKSQDKLAAEARTSEEKMQAFFQAQEAWMTANPHPRDADPESGKAYYQKRVELLDKWIPQLPEEDFLRVDRLRALSEIPGTADEALVSEGEKTLEASRKKTGSVIMFSTSPMQVAEIWAKRGLELERVPALVREGMEALEKQQQRTGAMQSDLYNGPDQKLMQENNRAQTKMMAWRTLVMAYAKTGKTAEARTTLASWEKALAERRNEADQIRKKREAEKSGATAANRDSQADRIRSTEDMILRNMPTSESQYNEALAELALAEKRKLDALVFYHSGLRASSAAPNSPNDIAKSELGRKASALWKELGGTQEGWQTWLDSLKAVSSSNRPDSSRWTAMNRALPELSLSDQAGKTWTLARVKGKTIMINVWATWCGPCRSELPYVQKLYDKVKAREDVQVITLNVDDNIGLIEPFLAENKYTFPVLIARSFIDGFTGPLGIPTNWIADRSGSIRLETVGFGGDGEEWIKNTLEQVEKVREGGP